MFLFSAEESPGGRPAAALAARVVAVEGGHQQGQDDDDGHHPPDDARVEEGQDNEDEQDQEEQVCHQAPGRHAVSACRVLPFVSHLAGVPCCRGGGSCQSLRTEPHLWARPGQPHHHGLLVTQTADEAPRDGGGLAAQRAGDGPGVILDTQQELQADGTERVLASQQLGWPDTAVGLPAHQTFEVILREAKIALSGACGLSGGGSGGDGLGLPGGWLLTGHPRHGVSGTWRRGAWALTRGVSQRHWGLDAV